MAAIPPARSEKVVPISLSEPNSDLADFLKNAVVIVDSPRYLRKGMRDFIRLRIMLADGVTFMADDSQRFIAHLRLPLMEVTPTGEVAINAAPGSSLSATWDVRSDASLASEGTLWVYYQSSPSLSPRSEPLALLAVPLTLRTVSIFNLDMDLAAFLGGLASLSFLGSASLVLYFSRRSRKPS